MVMLPKTNSLSSILTIDAADLPISRPDCVRPLQPFVIDGLVQGQLLSEITNASTAEDKLGAIPLNWRRNYTDSHLVNIQNYLKGVNAPPRIEKRSGLFRDYLDHVKREPETRWLITEEPTPSFLIQGTDLGIIGIDNLRPGYGHLFNEYSATTAYSLMFMANRGNASELHVDWDGRDVLLYQLFGRKRVVLFPPEAAPKLHPIDIFSTLRLSGLDDDERFALLSYAGGVEHLLLPGQTIFIPAFWWHHIDYVDLGMSVSFRFGGIDDPDALSLARVMHRDYHLQNIIAGTRNPSRAEACRSAVRRLLAASQQSHPNALTRYRELRHLAAQCHRETFPPGVSHPCVPWVSAEDFLDGVLCEVYRGRGGPDTPSNKRIPVWKEHLSAFIRRMGRKVSYFV